MSVHETLIRTVAFPALSRLYNREFIHFLRRWEKSQHWDRARIEELQWSSFRKLLRHSAESVPFYRDLFRERGLSPDDFRSFEDLSKLPILGKDDFHKHGLERFLSERTSAARRYRDSTSGTSGRPFTFYIDDRVIASRTARLIRENRWAGWEPGTRYVRLWGPHRETLAKRLFWNTVMRRVEVPAFTLRSNAEQVFSLLDRLRPRIIEAYASAAVDLAILCRDLGRSIPRPEAIIVSAETLTPAHRDLIEGTLGGTVFNRYGSRELGNVAHECERGGLHINAESFWIEEETHEGMPDARNLVITFLDNYTMPLLRYRIGDVGTLSTEICSCGRGLPLLREVVGRETDFFVFGNGYSLSFLFFNHFFEQYGGLIDRYQVEQVAEERLVVRLVPTGEFSDAARTSIEEGLTRHFQGRPFDIEIVSGIEPEPSGKLRIYKPLRTRTGS
jgi:phenylacetate-CoA ligase